MIKIEEQFRWICQLEDPFDVSENRYAYTFDSPARDRPMSINANNRKDSEVLLSIPPQLHPARQSGRDRSFGYCEPLL